MNPILCITRNNLNLTRRAIKSFRNQNVRKQEWFLKDEEDINNYMKGWPIVVVDNGSTDGTLQFLQSQHSIHRMCFNPQLGVAAAWNRGLDFLFKNGAEYCLVCNNDIELHPDSYHYLLEDGDGFVTLVGVRKMPAQFNLPPDKEKKRPHPDFSCFLIRKKVYETVGPFDENFKMAFCEDGDYDLRMYKKGIRASCIDFPYLHHGSMTVKNATLEEQRAIHKQAELNRAYFEKKWGFPMGSEAYYQALDKGSPEPSDKPASLVASIPSHKSQSVDSPRSEPHGELKSQPEYMEDLLWRPGSYSGL